MVVPQKVQNRTTIQPSNSTSECVFSRNEITLWKNNPVFLAASFTIAKRWKQPKCLLAVKWTKKKNIYIIKAKLIEIETRTVIARTEAVWKWADIGQGIQTSRFKMNESWGFDGQCVGFLVVQTEKNLPTVQETQVRSLGWDDPLEKEMATHSTILAWEIPWTEELGGLQPMGLQKVGHD